MRRRRDEDRDALPRWLTDPRPEDFPTPACHWECAYWDRVEQWRRVNPDAEHPPGVGPDAPWHPELI